MLSKIPIVCLLFVSLFACQFMAQREPGALKVSVVWPEETAFAVRAIPATTAKLEIRLEGEGLSEPVKRSLVRGAKIQETLTFTLPPGPKTVQASAVDSGGKTLANASTQVEIISGQKATAVLELQASTPNLPGLTGASGAPALPGQTAAGLPGLPAQGPGQTGLPNLPTARATSQPSASPSGAAGAKVPAPVGSTSATAPQPGQPGAPAPVPGTTAPNGTVTGLNPILNSVSPTSVAPGATLTISGSGFGLDRPESIVYIGPSRADILSVTTTQIQAIVPATAGILPVKVQVGAVTSNAINVTVATPGSTTAAPVNKPPVINTITADPNPVSGVSYPAELTVSATDPEGPLAASAYTWSCDGGCGAFNQTNGTKVTWTAPAVGGNYIIRVTVSDGVNTPVVKTLSVAVSTGSNTLTLTTGGNGIP